MKRTVSDLMEQRDLCHPPWIEENANVEDALKALRDIDVGALLVLNGGTIVGVFSERDFTRAYVAKASRVSSLTSIKDLMSSNVVYVTGDYRLDECMAIMAKLKIRHLPVLQGDTPIALLSMRHIMEALVEENKFMVEQLVTYITGSNVTEPQVAREGLIRWQTLEHIRNMTPAP